MLLGHVSLLSLLYLSTWWVLCLGVGGEDKTAELRSEEMELAGVESDASGTDQADVWSKGSESKPVDVEAGCGKSEDGDEELYIVPQCARRQRLRLLPSGRPSKCHR